MISKHQVLEVFLREPGRPPEFERLFADYIAGVTGWLSEQEAYLLWSLSGIVAPDLAVVEIGSYLGRSTVALAAGSRGARVYAVDPHTGDRSEAERGEVVDTYAGFLSNLESAGLLPRVTPMKMKSVEAAALFPGPHIGVLFVDGWHSSDAVEEDVHSWLPLMAQERTVVFDDWQSPDVSEGITRVSHLLPQLLGSIGKDLVFSNSSTAARLPIVQFASRHENVRRIGARLHLTEDLLAPFRKTSR